MDEFCLVQKLVVQYPTREVRRNANNKNEKMSTKPNRGPETGGVGTGGSNRASKVDGVC